MRVPSANWQCSAKVYIFYKRSRQVYKLHGVTFHAMSTQRPEHGTTTKQWNVTTSYFSVWFSHIQIFVRCSRSKPWTGRHDFRDTMIIIMMRMPPNECVCLFYYYYYSRDCVLTVYPENMRILSILDYSQLVSMYRHWRLTCFFYMLWTSMRSELFVHGKWMHFGQFIQMWFKLVPGAISRTTEGFISDYMGAWGSYRRSTCETLH